MKVIFKPILFLSFCLCLNAQEQDFPGLPEKAIPQRTKSVVVEDNPAHAAYGKTTTITESFISDGVIKILNYKVYAYDDQGREISVKVYDEDGVFCYETETAYDRFGRIALSTNPLKQITRYAYNDNHQKIEEELIGSGLVTQYAYDIVGRLTSKTENHFGGESFTHTYVYDAIGNLIREQNAYGHETTYEYDRLRKPVKKTFDGAVTKFKYNILDQISEETDPLGCTTYYAYNTHGKKTLITHPDGAVERFSYFPNGSLKQKWKADNTSVVYAYDTNGKLIEESALDPNGQLLKRESWIYKGNVLVEKRDAMGLVTEYAYDGAGRKILEKTGSKCTAYIYDGFDRVVKKILPLGASELYTYDVLDRVTSKTLQDEHGKIYAKEILNYDIYGNEIRKSILQTNDQWSLYQSIFGSDGKILEMIDPSGGVTTWKYDHHFINGKGQRVMACTITDTLGRVTVEVYDVHARIAQRDFYENDVLISHTEYSYDLAGNEIEKKEERYGLENNTSACSIVSKYDRKGRVISKKEMPEDKSTAYKYNLLGQLTQKTNPDGSVISYNYDFLGRLKELIAPEIHYAYTYDLHDLPIEVKDLIQHSFQKRFYDLEGNLLYEELAPEAIMRYSYDERQRLTRVFLIDGSSIEYEYDAFYLIRIDRYDSQGLLIYTCSCPFYDFRGNRMMDISPAGSILYSYNENCRKVKVDSTHWKCILDAFDPAGNLLSMWQIDPMGEQQIHFRYDQFNRLIQDDQDRSAYPNNGSCQSYTFDALNRLKSTEEVKFIYDGFNRCIKIQGPTGERFLLYVKDQEIGVIVNGQIQELRVVDPEVAKETTFAIEINKMLYFPVQDTQSNIVMLRDEYGLPIQYSRYFSFGEEVIYGDVSIANPWRLLNRRHLEKYFDVLSN